MTRDILISESEEETMETHHSVYANSQNIACHLHSYLEWGDYIYVEYRQNDYFSVLYNKKTGETRHYEDYINDLLVTEDVLTTEFLYANSKAAYDYFYPIKTDWYKESNVEFVPNLDKREELIKLLADEKDEHYVIFEYEFK